MEAAEGGVEFIVCITEGVPAQDEAWFYSKLKRDFPNVRLLGPNCPGIISPGKANIGITAGEIAKEGGPVGIVSRSGTLTYQALYELKLQDIGVTTCVGIGGDPVPGTSFIDCLEAFEADPDTKAVMMIGEIGGSAEEEAAEFIKTDDQAGRQLHRRRHRPGRQEDGPRRRHRLRAARAPPRARWTPSPPPASAWASTPPRPASTWSTSSARTAGPDHRPADRSPVGVHRTRRGPGHRPGPRSFSSRVPPPGYRPVRSATIGAKSWALSPGMTWYE